MTVTTGSPPQFNAGDKVRLRANPVRRGIIEGEAVFLNATYHYHVFFSADDAVYYSEDQLELCPVVQPLQLLAHREFLRDFLLLKLRSPLTDSLYSFGASRTKYRVYQFKPAIKFLSLPEQRILIADEVGLGKTIEAGIIYLELKARLDLQRVLVICPSGLRDKWRSELRSRFDDQFTILDAPAMHQFLRDFRENGASTRLRGISSLELLRREEFAQAFAELHVRFDLVVIDEAHHLRNASTMSYALGEILAAQSDALILLTATPLQTGNEDLFHLMQLVSPGEFTSFEQFAEQIAPNRFVNAASRLIAHGQFADALLQLRQVETTALGQSYRANPYYQESLDLLRRSSPPSEAEAVGLQRRMIELNSLARIFNRTRKREVSDAAVRSAHTVQVEFTPEERSLYDAIIEFVRWQLGSYGRHQTVPIFSVITRERQAASCIQALRNTFAASLEDHVRRLDVEESSPDLLDNGGSEDQIGRDEAARIRTLLSLCDALGDTDTKFDRFHESIRSLLAEEPDCKILVFSFFRGTLSYLYRRLAQLGYRVGTIHGDVPMDERTAIIDTFRTGTDIQIMLSSEVGAEGLDFEFCGAMFNYDLPWNPMRVEQRIGRLDRFGQQHERIRILNMVIANTVETRIFARLYERIRIFESSIGDLEAILGEEVQNLSRDLFMSRLTPEEEIQRADEAARRIEWRRQEQEQFDQQRSVFIGQDGFFEQEMSEIVESGRYVAPDEVRSLVECYISTVCPRSSLQPNDGDPTYALSAGPDLLHALSEFAGRNIRDGQAAHPFIQRAQTARAVPITFDSDTAQQRRLTDFVTVHHPLSRLAAEYYGRQGSPLPPRTCITIYASPEARADYAFFIYRLDIRSLTPESSLVPVLVNLGTGEVDGELAAGFLATIQHRYDDPRPEILCDAARMELMRSKAHEHVARVVGEREAETRQRNHALVERRLVSVEMSNRFRIDAALRQVTSTNDDRIRRMRRAQVANLEASLATKRAEIESHRDVSVGYELVASGLVRFAATISSQAVSSARPRVPTHGRR